MLLMFFFCFCFLTEPRKCVLISLGNLLSLLFNGRYGSGEICVFLKAKESVRLYSVDSAQHDHFTESVKII